MTSPLEVCETGDTGSTVPPAINEDSNGLSAAVASVSIESTTVGADSDQPVIDNSSRSIGGFRPTAS